MIERQDDLVSLGELIRVHLFDLPQSLVQNLVDCKDVLAAYDSILVDIPKPEGNYGPNPRTAVDQCLGYDLVFLYFELVVESVADFEEVEDGVGQRRIGVFSVVEVFKESILGEVGPSYCEFGLLDG